MEAGQQEKRITIHVIDDNQWEPDETFFVKLSLADGQESRAKLGSKTIALVTIINDDGKRFPLMIVMVYFATDFFSFLQNQVSSSLRKQSLWLKRALEKLRLKLFVLMALMEEFQCIIIRKISMQLEIEIMNVSQTNS